MIAAPEHHQINRDETNPIISILVVDDHRDQHEIVRKSLQHLPLKVYSAETGQHALQLIEEREYALAVIDLVLPDISGYELAEQFRRYDSAARMPLIFCSGVLKKEENIFQGYETGIVDFLLKPVHPRVLESKVRVFVELDFQRRELAVRNRKLEEINRSLRASLSETQTILEEARAARAQLSERMSAITTEKTEQIAREGQMIREINRLKNDIAVLQEDLNDQKSAGEDARWWPDGRRGDSAD